VKLNKTKRVFVAVLRGHGRRNAARRCASSMTRARFLNLPHALGERIVYTFGAGQRVDEA
jgi:hypothetical protein